MLKKIRIQNFKSLEDLEIEVKPLMLLFGQNSSGKSTFLKALMFLKENLFPLNQNKTLYKINEYVDLISFKDIITGNDIKKVIQFEFFFEDNFDYPTIDVLNRTYTEKAIQRIKETFQFQKEKLTNSPENSFPWHQSKEDSITELSHYYNNAIDLLNSLSKSLNVKPLNESLDLFLKDYYNNNLYTGNFDILDDLFKTNKLNYSIMVQFIDNIHGYNLDKITLHDKTNHSHISLRICRDNGTLRLQELDFMYDEIISKLLTKDLADTTLKFGNIPNIQSCDNFFSENFVKYADLTENEIKSLNSLNDTTKKDLYYNISMFLYSSFRLIPVYLDRFLNYQHLPTTRAYPKNIYLLNESSQSFSDNYYGLFSELMEDQLKIYNGMAGNVNYGILRKLYTELDNYKSGNNNLNIEKNEYLKELVEKYNKINSEMGFDTSGYRFKALNQKPLPFSSEELIEKFLKNIIVDINLNLHKCGFLDIFHIEYDTKQWEFAKLWSFNPGNSETLMSNASSGMIQALPIFVFLSLLKNNPAHYNWRFDELPFLDYASIPHYVGEGRNLSTLALYIEQPELHLHPALQSKLAKLFLNNLKEIDFKCFVVLETHSEHIIRTIQVEIAKGNFDKSLLGVYYFNKIEGKTSIKQMEIEDNGFFKEPWPDGFFDDSTNLSWELLGASRKN